MKLLNNFDTQYILKLENFPREWQIENSSSTDERIIMMMIKRENCWKIQQS